MLDRAEASLRDEPIAEVKDLRVEFQTKDGPIVGVSDVSFNIKSGETVCIVGESGSGKSVSSLSLMRLHSIPLLIDVTLTVQLLVRSMDLLLKILSLLKVKIM